MHRDVTTVELEKRLAAALDQQAATNEILLDDSAPVESLGALALRGFTQPVPVFRLAAP